MSILCLNVTMKLKRIKDNIKKFIKEFKNYDIYEISDESIQVCINTHN